MIGCVVEHEGRRIFEIDPDGYDFNPKLHMVKTAKISVPVQCKHCENPACLAACPVKCIKVINDAVVIDQKTCIGCKSCMQACPFGVIDMIAQIGTSQADGTRRVVANKCDLCVGTGNGPACVRVCPTSALTLMSEDALKESVHNRRVATAEAAKAVADAADEV
jgi:electron transport protein HydN